MRRLLAAVVLAVSLSGCELMAIDIPFLPGITPEIPEPPAAPTTVDEIVPATRLPGGWRPPVLDRPLPERDAGAGTGDQRQTQNAIDYILAAFPWIEQLGIADLLRQWAVEGVTGDALVGRIRGTEQYKNRFVSIRRADGTLRMNEAQYMQREVEYRQLLKQYGRPGVEYDDPRDYASFFENEIDPNEAEKRLQTWDQVQRGSQEVRDSFYVYAGMKLTDEELYRAAVNPQAGAQLADEYTKRVSKTPLDAQTWIQRATEVGLERVASTLRSLADRGVDTGRAIGEVERLDPAFAQQMVTALYAGSLSGKYLSLNELMRAFEYAMIGSAASGQGFALPTVERLEELRQAGVDRSRALEGYGMIASNRSRFDAQLGRLREDLNGFTTEDYERAIFLQTGKESEALRRAQSREKSLQQSSGFADFERVGDSGLLAQRGLSGYQR